MRFSSRPVSRPVSSPGRTETNPPLLMRFLRTNTNSRSRSRPRSRSKPIFFRRKNATSATETQEPSSPKVTCMGQVRINRSKKSKPGINNQVTGNAPQRRSKWVKNTFLCYPKIKPNCFSPVWRKWKSFSHVTFSRKSEKISNSSRSEPILNRSTVDHQEQNLPREKQESFTSTPPRNAFLLTRCRSAPYRSASPSLDYNIEIKEDGDNAAAAAASPPSGNVSGSGESMVESEEGKRNSFGDLRERVVLTRCKSEPARVGERLDSSDMCYRRKGRLGFT